MISSQIYVSKESVYSVAYSLNNINCNLIKKTFCFVFPIRMWWRLLTRTGAGASTAWMRWWTPSARLKSFKCKCGPSKRNGTLLGLTLPVMRIETHYEWVWHIGKVQIWSICLKMLLAYGALKNVLTQSLQISPDPMFLWLDIIGFQQCYRHLSHLLEACYPSNTTLKNTWWAVMHPAFPGNPEIYFHVIILSKHKFSS